MLSLQHVTTVNISPTAQALNTEENKSLANILHLQPTGNESLTIPEYHSPVFFFAAKTVDESGRFTNRLIRDAIYIYRLT